MGFAKEFHLFFKGAIFINLHFLGVLSLGDGSDFFLFFRCFFRALVCHFVVKHQDGGFKAARFRVYMFGLKVGWNYINL